MFPGCTLSELRARQADVLREGGFGPTPCAEDRRSRVGRALVHLLASLVMALGL